MSTIIREEAPIDHETPVAGSPVTSAIKWAIISSVVGFLLTLIGYNTGLTTPGNGMVGSILFGLLSVAISVGFVIFGLREYRDQVNGGYMTFGQGVIWTLIYAVIAGVLGALLHYVFLEFLAPDYLDLTLEGVATTMKSMGMSQDDIDRAVEEMAATTTTTSQLITVALGGFGVSLVIGLICSAIMKRQPTTGY